jgi:hypothetical protein
MFPVISIARRVFRFVGFDVRWLIIRRFYIYPYKVYPAVKIGYLPLFQDLICGLLKEEVHGEGLFRSDLIMIRGIFPHDIADIVFHFYGGIYVPWIRQRLVLRVIGILWKSSLVLTGSRLAIRARPIAALGYELFECGAGDTPCTVRYFGPG